MKYPLVIAAKCILQEGQNFMLKELAVLPKCILTQIFIFMVNKAYLKPAYLPINQFQINVEYADSDRL